MPSPSWDSSQKSTYPPGIRREGMNSSTRFMAFTRANEDRNIRRSWTLCSFLQTMLLLLAEFPRRGGF